MTNVGWHEILSVLIDSLIWRSRVHVGNAPTALAVGLEVVWCGVWLFK